MGGANNFRPMWQQYANDIDGLIYVVDSSDSVRFTTAAEELHAVINLPSVQANPVPILVLLNKNDIEGSAPQSLIEKELQLEKISNHPVLVKSVCSQYPKEIIVGLEWLVARHV